MTLREQPLQLWRRQCAERRRLVADLKALADRLRSDEKRLGGDLGRADAVARSLATIDRQIAEAGAALAVAERQLMRHERASADRTEDSAPRRHRAR